MEHIPSNVEFDMAIVVIWYTFGALLTIAIILIDALVHRIKKKG